MQNQKKHNTIQPRDNTMKRLKPSNHLIIGDFLLVGDERLDLRHLP